MKRGRKILSGAVVLLIAMAMVFSSIAIANSQIKQSNIETHTIHEGYGQGARGDIVWDNGMAYLGLLAAQEPVTSAGLDAYPADDFIFDEDTEVCDVHWVGGYYGGTPPWPEWPWCILFYYDRGDGAAPGNPYIGPFCYEWDDIDKTVLEEGYWEMSVDLPENYIFNADTKYWISIWAVGDHFPQSGWGYHDDPVLLHEAVFKSVHFGFLDWTDLSILIGVQADMCFQLTTKEEGTPLICCDPMVMSWADVKPGANLTGKFHVWNCGDPGTTLNWQVDSWPAWMTDGGVVFVPASGSEVHGGPGTEVTFTFTAPNEQNQVFSGAVQVINTDDSTDFCKMPVELETPRTRGIFFNFLEQLANRFPILQYLFGF